MVTSIIKANKTQTLINNSIRFMNKENSLKIWPEQQQVGYLFYIIYDARSHEHKKYIPSNFTNSLF
jgi:hypothetical protein